MPVSRLVLLLWLCFAAAAQARTPEPGGDSHAVVAAASDDAGKSALEDEPDGGTVPCAPTLAERPFEPAAAPSPYAVTRPGDLRPLASRARAPPRR